MVGILSHLKKMKEIINEQLITQLKKSRRISILSIILVVALTILFIVPLFIFANRTLQYLFLILITIIATLGASVTLVIIVISIIPLNNFLKMCRLSINGNKYSTKGKIELIAEKITHYRGVPVRELKIIDLEENNKSYTFYVEQNLVGNLMKDNVYTFTTYQSFITAYEEDIRG